MGTTAYLFAALAVVWLGLMLYVWTLRRSVQRLTEDLEGLSPPRGG